MSAIDLSAIDMPGIDAPGLYLVFCDTGFATPNPMCRVASESNGMVIWKRVSCRIDRCRNRYRAGCIKREAGGAVAIVLERLSTDNRYKRYLKVCGIRGFWPR